MKKLFSILVLSAILITTLISCGTQGSTDSQNECVEEPAPENDEIIIQKNFSYYDELNINVELKDFPTEEGAYLNLFKTKDALCELALNADEIDSSLFDEYNIALVTLNKTVGNELDSGYLGFKNFSIDGGFPSIQIDYYIISSIGSPASHKIEKTWALKIPKMAIPESAIHTDSLNIFYNDVTGYSNVRLSAVSNNEALSESHAWLISDKNEYKPIKDKYGFGDFSFSELTSNEFVLIIYTEKTIENAILYDGFSSKANEATITVKTKNEVNIKETPTLVYIYIPKSELSGAFLGELEITIQVEEIIKN